MRKSIYTLMVSTLIAAASMTACSSQPSETTTAETTAAESTQENDTSAESSDASETTSAGEKETAQTTDADYAEDETLSEKEITELYRGFARSLQSIIANKNMNDLAAHGGRPLFPPRRRRETAADKAPAGRPGRAERIRSA